MNVPLRTSNAKAGAKIHHDDVSCPSVALFYTFVFHIFSRYFYNFKQEGLAVASIARDVVVEMTPHRDDSARYIWIGI